MAKATSFRLVCRPSDHVLFRLKDGAITTAKFLSMAHQLADGLPAGDHVVNLCHDRLHFVLGLAAALLRGQVSLLTSDRSPERLRSLQEGYPGLYSLSNDQAVSSPLPHHHYRAQPARPWAGEPDNPEIPASRLAAIVFTSGSTGEPVGHAKSWGALAERSLDAAACFDMTERNRPASWAWCRRSICMASRRRYAAAACACIHVVRCRILSGRRGKRLARGAGAARAGDHALADPRPAAEFDRIGTT